MCKFTDQMVRAQQKVIDGFKRFKNSLTLLLFVLRRNKRSIFAVLREKEKRTRRTVK